MKFQKLTVFFLLISLISYGQEVQVESNTLENQFDKINKVSTNYLTYKVISKIGFQNLKTNVLDSLKASKQLVLEKESLLRAEKENNEKTKATLAKTEQKLESALDKENSISLFGSQVSKVTYSVILWGLVIIFFLGMLFFIFKFFKNNVITKNAENSLITVEEELEDHRKKSLEREQKLRRQLQDEINKQRNS